MSRLIGGNGTSCKRQRTLQELACLGRLPVWYFTVPIAKLPAKTNGGIGIVGEQALQLLRRFLCPIEARLRGVRSGQAEECLEELHRIVALFAQPACPLVQRARPDASAIPAPATAKVRAPDTGGWCAASAPASRGKRIDDRRAVLEER